MASKPRPGMVEARHLAREWSPRAVETLYDVMTNGATLRRARIASSGAVAQIFGSGSRVGGRSKLSRRAESILDGTLRFSDEYRPVNRSHCGVRGGGDSGISLLLASARGYSQHRARGRRPVRYSSAKWPRHRRGRFGDRSASIANQLAAAQGILNVAQLMESEAATAMPNQTRLPPEQTELAGHIRRRAPMGPEISDRGGTSPGPW
jgi:hypothetical protein